MNTRTFLVSLQFLQCRFFWILDLPDICIESFAFLFFHVFCLDAVGHIAELTYGQRLGPFPRLAEELAIDLPEEDRRPLEEVPGGWVGRPLISSTTLVTTSISSSASAFETMACSSKASHSPGT